MSHAELGNGEKKDNIANGAAEDEEVEEVGCMRSKLKEEQTGT